MCYITKDGLKKALMQLGLESGDTVLIHSDISSFGTTENFSRKDTLKVFYEALMEILGSEGTICTPAYFYDYARKQIPFDITLSEVSKELGVFAKFINSLPNRKRSCNPLTSIAAIGKNADYICSIQNRHSYGEDSAYNKLHKLNAKYLLMGVDIYSLTFLHYIEYMVGVPHYYNKLFPIPIYDNNKLIFEESFAAVRYLGLDINFGNIDSKENKDSTTKILIEKNIISHICYLNGDMYIGDMNTLFNYYKEELYKKPYICLLDRPNFKAGEYPMK